MSKSRDIIGKHFDEKALSISNKNSPYVFFNQTLNKHGSNCYLGHLSDPYRYAESLFPEDVKNLNILDCCCGTGVFSILPALNGAFVFGFDISEESIIFAKKRADKFGVSDKADFRTMDISDMNYDQNFFDVAIIYGSLSLMNTEEAIKSIKKVLKPKGKLIVVDSLGYNPFFNWNRKKSIRRWTNQDTGDYKTFNHKDLGVLRNNFSSVNYKTYNLTVLIIYYLNRVLRKSLSANYFNLIDKMLLRIPIIKWLAFKIVLVCEDE